MLHGPIQAEWDPATDEWTIKAIATFGGVLRRVFAVPVSEAELDAYNAESDRLNALAAANAGGSATSDIHNQSCPRRGFNAWRDGVIAFGSRRFRLGELPLPVAA